MRQLASPSPAVGCMNTSHNAARPDSFKMLQRGARHTVLLHELHCMAQAAAEIPRSQQKMAYVPLAGPMHDPGTALEALQEPHSMSP